MIITRTPTRQQRPCAAEGKLKTSRKSNENTITWDSDKTAPDLHDRLGLVNRNKTRLYGTAKKCHLHDGLGLVVSPRVQRVPLQVVHVHRASTFASYEPLQLLRVEQADPLHRYQVPATQKAHAKMKNYTTLRGNNSPADG